MDKDQPTPEKPDYSKPVTVKFSESKTAIESARREGFRVEKLAVRRGGYRLSFTQDPDVHCHRG